MLWVRIAQLINDESWKWNLKRVLKLFIWIFVLSFVVGIIIGLVWVGAFFAFDPRQKGAPVDAQLTMEQISLASLKIMIGVGVVAFTIYICIHQICCRCEINVQKSGCKRLPGWYAPMGLHLRNDASSNLDYNLDFSSGLPAHDCHCDGFGSFIERSCHG